jgi:hypothetical protein
MLQYQIQPSSRRCCVTGRELKPGERYFSVLLEVEGKLVRQDYAPEAWPGPPGEAFSFWMGKVPEQEGPHRPPINDALLLDCFTRLENDARPDRVNFRYVLALLLLRRKRLKFEEARTDHEREILRLRCSQSRVVHEVVNPRLTDEELATVQDEVYQVLGWQ